MMECMILGDSIAYGVSNIRKECVAYAKSGINSHDWVTKNIDRDLSAKTVIISLGSNDLKNVNTREEIVRVRNKVKAGRVFWILPAIKPNVQAIVREVAQQYSDTVLPIAQLSTDGVHPTYNGYRQLAEETK